MSKLSKPIIRIDPDEELNLICKLLFYRSTGYHSNAKALRDACKKEGYNFPYKKVREWLHRQNEWQKYAPSPKNISRVSYGKFHVQIVYINVTSYFLRMINIRGRHGKQYYRL